MAVIIRFPRPFRRKPEGAGPRPHPFRDATKHRLKAIIARALEILDSLDGDPRDAA